MTHLEIRVVVKKKLSKPKTTKTKNVGFGEGLEFSLSNVRLIDNKSHLRITHGAFPTKMQMKAACEGAAPETVDGVIYVFYRVTGEVHCSAEPDTGSESRIDIACIYEVQVKASRMPTKEEVEFAAGMAANIAWPYVRAFVTNVTAEMAVPPIIMPLLRATPDKGLELIRL